MANNNLPVKQVPSAIEAEIAVIGSIFMEPSSIIIARDSISSDDFYDIKNKLIYKTMILLNDAGMSVDVATVVGSLKTNQLLDQAGGTDYLLEISKFSYSASNIETYLEMIYSASMKRKAIGTLEELVQKGYEAGDVTKYIDNVERTVFDMSKHRKTTSFETIRAVTEQLEKNTEARSKQDTQLVGFDTGFPTLNQYTQGFQGGQLIILAARPAMGKSAMALNLAMNISTINDVNVAIFSLEMSNEQLVQRMVAATGSIKLKMIQSGHMDKNSWVRFSPCLERVANMKIFFDDSSDSTIESIRAKCRKLKQENGLGMIVIDYLQLIDYDDDSSKMSQVQKITIISRSLKLMARELDVPIIVLSQLSRAVEGRDDKKPIMSDLRDSGSIEQDADIVLFLYSEDYYENITNTTSKIELLIAKHRNGETGSVEFVFEKNISKFNNFAYKEEGKNE
jgi:replicative DNA helicase